MKLILTLISLIFTSFALQTDASCVEFVKGYYNCQFGKQLIIISPILNHQIKT